MQLKVNRFDTVNSLGSCKLTDYVYDCTDESCESITDKSAFVPESEALRKLKGQQALTSSEIQEFYDYPDGKANLNDKVPVARMKGADIAEISQEIKSEQSRLKEKVADAQAEQKANEKFAARLKAATDSVSGKSESKNS